MTTIFRGAGRRAPAAPAAGAKPAATKEEELRIQRMIVAFSTAKNIGNYVSQTKLHQAPGKSASSILGEFKSGLNPYYLPQKHFQIRFIRKGTRKQNLEMFLEKYLQTFVNFLQ